MAGLSLPRVIRLPFGWVLKVRLVTAAQLAEVTGWSLEESRRTDGAWLCDTKTIYIRSSLPAKQRRYVLGHELLHAVNDWIGYELGVRRMEA